MLDRWPLVALLLASLLVGSVASAAPVEFDREIRPILSNKCFKCHGPEAASRKSGLRFDVREVAVAPAESGKPAIVPGKSAESELVRRINASDDDERMPPPDSKKVLNDAEKELLTRWIDQGAKYQKHWSLVRPQRAELPKVKHAAWPRNPVDYFVLARLEAAGLEPSPEADRATLIRRLSLDLTGLPPTLAEIDAFLADKSPDAYERVVDRLLASNHYGERMALDWLDAARFADTHGYHIDSGRDMTRWREWVINAFNGDLPFDQFTIDQLAGDLLPNATLEQKIASGFNRNNMINFEGGAIPEEYLTAYIIDRVNTTGTVWLGLTIGCTQCHDHKFDPFKQKEYYQLFAFFHNVPENGLDGSKGNAAPVLKTPSADQTKQLAELDAQIAAAKAKLDGNVPDIDAAQKTWEQAALEPQSAAWRPLKSTSLKSAGGATLAEQPDGAITVTGTNPANDTYTVATKSDLETMTGIRLEALVEPSLPTKGPGRSVNGNIVLTHVAISAKKSDGTVVPAKIKSAVADFSQKDFPIEYAIDDQPKTGWAIDPQTGKAHDAIFELAEPLTHVAELSVVLDFQSQFGQHQLARFRLAATASPNPREARGLPAEIVKVLTAPADKRAAPEQAALRTYYRQQVSPVMKSLAGQIATMEKQRAEIDAKIPTAMVMQEMAQPRDTFVLMRGQYDKPGEKVTAGVPASLPPLPADAPKNRLGLARWLVAPEQPLTSRVIVNRYWQLVFGTGLVKTAEDFGSQGEQPSHPELLDWLAVEFQQPTPAPAGSGAAKAWDVKGLIRLLVTSATYRQQSVTTKAQLATDPEDRLLGRAPRLRLQAELIRDQALAISGLLNPQIGGHSVSPYQPPGLWEELASRADGANWTAQVYTQSHGPDLYRRGMYTFWKRTSPPPTLVTFDAPDRETCTVRRARTNTPLQALVLLNDPTYVEAARKLAERMMAEGGASPAERTTFAFRLATGRAPSAREQTVLETMYQQALARFQGDAAAAQRLLKVGESPVNATMNPAELAAWSVVANAILNLDESITRG